MKENIEEVIERLEKSINDVYFNILYSQEDKEKDLQILLSDYKRVLKENEQLRTEVNSLLNENKEVKDLIAHKNEYTKKLEKDLFENCNNYVIPIQKVKDKIEELKEKSGGNVFHIQQAINAEIRLLKELIEEREEK